MKAKSVTREDLVLVNKLKCKTMAVKEVKLFKRIKKSNFKGLFEKPPTSLHIKNTNLEQPFTQLDSTFKKNQSAQAPVAIDLFKGLLKTTQR